ncbi:MAG: ATP synthase F1 subunit epsilon [Bacilli bacterium]|nr:ATP synthase F1 subunit epsilon [Bacilli bacterium]
MLKLTIVTPKGTSFSGDVDYVVVDGNAGQMGILENHVPTIVPVKEGFLKKVVKEEEYYFYLSGAILELSHNIITVIAQEASSGDTLELAKKEFEEIRLQEKRENRRKLIDFTKMEKDLAKSIKEMKAGSL